MRYLLLAIQFLTIIPIRIPGQITQSDLLKSVVFFPVVGIIYGLSAYALFILFQGHLAFSIIAMLIVTFLILLNGAFHLDGLADTFDALAIKSSGHRENDITRRLAVMKDSHIGAIGAIAIMLAILFKYVLIHAVITQSFSGAILIVTPVIARWLMTLTLYHAKPARTDGLGKIFLSKLSSKHILVSTSVTIAVAFFCLNTHLMTLTLCFAICLLNTVVLIRTFNHVFGGLTGDNVGAINEINEIIFLLGWILWQ